MEIIKMIFKENIIYNLLTILSVLFAFLTILDICRLCYNRQNKEKIFEIRFNHNLLVFPFEILIVMANQVLIRNMLSLTVTTISLIVYSLFEIIKSKKQLKKINSPMAN
jgi:hypothetical protein